MNRGGGPRARRLPVLLETHAAALAECRRCTFDDPAVVPGKAQSHVGENVGETDTHVLIVEFKA